MGRPREHFHPLDVALTETQRQPSPWGLQVLDALHRRQQHRASRPLETGETYKAAGAFTPFSPASLCHYRVSFNL